MSEKPPEPTDENEPDAPPSAVTTTDAPDDEAEPEAGEPTADEPTVEDEDTADTTTNGEGDAEAVEAKASADAAEAEVDESDGGDVEVAAPEDDEARSRSRLPAWVVPVGVVGVVGFVMALPLWGLARAPGPPMEEGFMLVFPERLLEGDVANEDFLHLYGPGSLWLIAGFFQVLGIELWVERLVGLLQLVGVVGGVTFVAYRWGPWPAITAGTTTAVLIMPPTGLTALAWLGGLALAVWTVAVTVRALDPDRDERSRRRALISGGLLAGAALLFRPDLVVALGLPLGVMWLWGLDRTGRRQLLGGIALGVSPYLVHMVMAGPGNAIEGMVLEPVFDLRPGRTLPFPPAWDHFTSHLNGALVFRDWPWLPVPHLGQPQQLFVWVWILLAVSAAIVAIAVKARRSGSPEGWRLLALGLLCVGILPQAIQRPDTAHMAWVSAVPFGLLVPALVEWARLRGGGVRLRAAVSLVPLAVMLVVIPHYTIRWYADYVGQTLDYRRNGISPETAAPCLENDQLPICHDAIVEIENRGRSFYSGRADGGAAAQQLLDDVEQLAEPGQRLVVGTGDLRKTAYSESYLYFLLPQLEPGTRYIEMDPGVANAEDSGLADELRQSDVVILSTVYDSWDEPNTSTDLGSDEPNQVLAEDYCLEESYGSNASQDGRGWYELYLRC